MSFILKKGKTKTVYLPATTSQVYTKDTLVTLTSGLLVAVTSSTAAVDVVGVIRKAVTAADTDYATARLLPVDVPTERFTVWEADVTTGLVVADIGAEVDLTDSATVNRGASSIKVVKAIGVITTTKGLFWVKFQAGY